MEYVYLGASIECEGAQIVTRRVNVGSIIEFSDIGRCLKYSCDKNSESTILKELNPKKPLYKDGSHLNLGDSIKAEGIVVYVKKIRKIKFEKIDLTHRHNAQMSNSDCYTFAEITQVFPNLRSINDPRQIPAATKKLK